MPGDGYSSVIEKVIDECMHACDALRCGNPDSVYLPACACLDPARMVPSSLDVGVSTS